MATKNSFGWLGFQAKPEPPDPEIVAFYRGRQIRGTWLELARQRRVIDHAFAQSIAIAPDAAARKAAVTAAFASYGPKSPKPGKRKHVRKTAGNFVTRQLTVPSARQ